jgi:hypothetical protein
MIGGVFLVSYGKGDGQMKFTPPVADLTSPAVQGELDARLLKSVHAAWVAGFDEAGSSGSFGF